MKYRCISCGADFDINEQSTKCRFCEKEISPKNDASGNFARALEERDEQSARLTRLVDAYVKSGESKDIYTAVSSYDEYVSIFGIDKIWRAFIVSAAGAAVRARDTALQVFLKNHSKDYDHKREHSNLFRSILLSYPKFGTNNDWEDMIQATRGNREEFSVISDSIIQYIAKEKDKAFAIDIFNLISAKGAEWLEIGKYYIRAFLSNEEIATGVFTKEAFDGAARRFVTRLIAYCKQYLGGENGIAIEETKVYASYTAACREHKKRSLILGGIAAAVTAVIALTLVLILNSVVKDSITFNVDKVLEVSYGDELVLDGCTVTYKKRSGKQFTEPLTVKMLNGYTADVIGQQSAEFEFRGVTASVIIIVKSTQLDPPTVTQSGNRIVWDTVPNAKYYSVYVNASANETLTTELPVCDLSALPVWGELTVTVRAMTDVAKYESSPMSAALKITKLAPAENLGYSGGKLTWDAVDGADGYELKVNGTPYVASTNELTVTLVKGSNEISITSVATDTSVVHGIMSTTLTYDKLSPITSMTYKNNTVSWTADANARVYSVYVDGELWKDFNRTNFNAASDGFTETFGDGAHKIEIVCKTSSVGVEPSEKNGYTVVFGNTVSVSEGIVAWGTLGAGATYYVTVNGSLHTYGDSFFSLSDCDWSEGENEVSVTAKMGGEDFILESFTMTKHTRPSVSVTDSAWSFTDGALVSLDGGEWSTSLPDTAELAAGTHTVKAKMPATSQFEIESYTTEIVVMKLSAPVIKIENGAISCTVDPSAKLSLYYYDTSSAQWLPIESLDSITRAGDYTFRARLVANGGTEYDYYLSSDYSATVSATKPEAPDISYDAATGLVSSTTTGATFYYVDGNGEEHELVGGRVSSLPGGVFSIYARLNATEDNRLNSENTPESLRVSVFNLNVELIVTPIQNSNQCYIVFKGCQDVESLSFSYKIRYLNKSGEEIGILDKTDTTINGKKTGDTISALVNYRLGVEFDGDYSHSDVAKIEVTVYINSGSETLMKTYTVSV